MLNVKWTLLLALLSNLVPICIILEFYEYSYTAHEYITSFDTENLSFLYKALKNNNNNILLAKIGWIWNTGKHHGSKGVKQQHVCLYK